VVTERRVLLLVSASLAEQPMQISPPPLGPSALVPLLVSPRPFLLLLFLWRVLVVLLLLLVLWRDWAQVRRFRLYLTVLHVL